MGSGALASFLWPSEDTAQPSVSLASGIGAVTSGLSYQGKFAQSDARAGSAQG